MFHALALVITPDYQYRNPVTGTLSPTVAGAKLAAVDYAARTWPHDENRQARFLSELTIEPAPAHAKP